MDPAHKAIRKVRQAAGHQAAAGTKGAAAAAGAYGPLGRSRGVLKWTQAQLAGLHHGCWQPSIGFSGSPAGEHAGHLCCVLRLAAHFQAAGSQCGCVQQSARSFQPSSHGRAGGMAAFCLPAAAEQLRLGAGDRSACSSCTLEPWSSGCTSSGCSAAMASTGNLTVQRTPAAVSWCSRAQLNKRPAGLGMRAKRLRSSGKGLAVNPACTRASPPAGRAHQLDLQPRAQAP